MSADDQLAELRAKHQAEEEELERTFRYEGLLERIHQSDATEQEWAEFRALRDDIVARRQAVRLERAATAAAPGDAVARPATVEASTTVRGEG